LDCKELAEGKVGGLLRKFINEEQSPLGAQAQQRVNMMNPEERLREATRGMGAVETALYTALFEDLHGAEVSAENDITSGTGKCNHGHVPFRKNGSYGHFMDRFFAEFDRHDELVTSFRETLRTTREIYPEIWSDPSKLELIRKFFLSWGTQNYLDGKGPNAARAGAYLARYIEQYVATYLNKTQSNLNWSKVFELESGDEHTVFSYLKRNIPCSCLDKRYKEVKHIEKTGVCWNPKCRLANGNPSKRSLMTCIGCEHAQYCSRSCQKADWHHHKSHCKMLSASRAKFDAKQEKP
jgi:hypothetical protein